MPNPPVRKKDELCLKPVDKPHTAEPTRPDGCGFFVPHFPSFPAGRYPPADRPMPILRKRPTMRHSVPAPEKGPAGNGI